MPSSRGSAGSSVNECEHLRRRQFVVAMRRQIPCGASFCIRKNWAPLFSGVTILWNLVPHFYRPLTKNYFIIAKGQKTTIIHTVFGVSSNGRTRDFGSLYHGSNPCAPTRINKNTLLGVFIYSWAHGWVRGDSRSTNTRIHN